jgi:membrane-bound lytic murein transglycosylase D
MFFCGSFLLNGGEVYGQDQTERQSLWNMFTTSDPQGVDKPAKAGDGTSRTSAEATKSSGNMETSRKDAKEENQETERDIMEGALQLLDESRSYWERGDLEKALDMLDQAYALLLDTDGDPDIARQKDDLRLLISKRILMIYTSKHATTSGKRSEIPTVLNADVEKEIRAFQTYERDFFIQSYKRSGFYRPIILRELKKAGLPEELSWLPLVESGFKTHALSSARALGLWQFIPSTGYKYGLNRDEWIDERLNVEKSTRAAIDYLKDLHEMFGDWLTVLAAYNCGEGRVLKVISRQHINYLDRFWDLYHQLPNETARYVPRFLATLLIIKDPQKYNMELEKHLDQPYAYEVVNTSKSMKIQDIAQRIAVSEELLNALNTELRQRITPDKEYNLRVPPGMGAALVKAVDDIPQAEKPRPAFIKYKAKRGETVVSIARKYGTSVGAIMSCNNFSSRKRLKPGQRLIIPLGGQSYAKVKSNNPANGVKEPSSGDIIKYRVKKGDTLASVSKRYDTSIQEIRKLNKLKKKALRPGQIILISGSNGTEGNGKTGGKTTPKKTGVKADKRRTDNRETGSKTYIIKEGDNLTKIAKESGISLDKLLEVNKLEQGDKIQPGQVITIK